MTFKEVIKIQGVLVKNLSTRFSLYVLNLFDKSDSQATLTTYIISQSDDN